MESQIDMEVTLQEVSTATIVREIPAESKILKRRIGFFTGDEHHVITLEEGSKYTRNFRKSAGKNAVKGGFFGKEIFEKILDQRSCVGIRLYHAQHSDGKPTFVLTGVQTNGNDMYEGMLGQEARLSPPWVSNPNPLNSDNWKREAVVRRESKIFTGRENHYATLAEATVYTKNFRDTLNAGQSKGRFFGANIFRKILAQSECVGIRAYHGIHDDGSPTSVLVGVDEYGFDQISGVVGQRAFECPPWCGGVSPLNR
jgi:hypothetical protein